MPDDLTPIEVKTVSVVVCSSCGMVFPNHKPGCELYINPAHIPQFEELINKLLRGEISDEEYNREFRRIDLEINSDKVFVMPTAKPAKRGNK